MPKKTILLLEDEALIAMDIAMELEELDFDVVNAGTIEDALNALESNHIDMAVLDLNINGHQTDGVARTLRARQIPFVVCSGSQFEDVAEVFRGVRAIAKPYRPEDLHAAVAATLESRA
jgi:DNA-binding response OmpR family regulator